MDCSNRQAGSCVRRPQLSPFETVDMGCPATAACRNRRNEGCSGMPVGMGYVPWQQWGQTYSMEQGLKQGTIFPELDYPFLGGGGCYDVQQRR